MRSIVRGVSVLWLALAAIAAFGRDLPHYDAVAKARVLPNADASLAQKTADYIRPGTKVQGDNRFGVPTFLWAGRDIHAPSLRPGAHGAMRPEEAAARAHLGNYADVYNLNAEDVEAASVRFVHNIGKGPIIVKFVQKIGDVEIILEEMNVLMNRQLELVAISGYISSLETPAAQPGANWNLDLRSGAAAAYNDLAGGQLSGTQLVPLGARDGYEFLHQHQRHRPRHPHPHAEGPLPHAGRTGAGVSHRSRPAE